MGGARNRHCFNSGLEGRGVYPERALVSASFISDIGPIGKLTSGWDSGRARERFGVMLAIVLSDEHIST